MDKLYEEQVTGIERSEYRTVMPVSDLNFNTPNNYTVFKLDHGDAFYDSRIMYHIHGELVKKSDGTEYPAASTIQLIDNFPAYLFSRIELKKHNTLLDSVDHPGITSQVKGLVSYSKSQMYMLPTSGFISKFSGGGKFEALGTLGHLGLGFFDHLRHPMYKGGFEITFTRAEDNDAIYHWSGNAQGATEPADGKVVIKSFVLRVPLVEYETNAKSQLIAGLKQMSDKDSLKYTYLQWQCIDKKGVFGSTFNFDVTGLYRNVYNPKFIIVALQTNRANKQKKNPSRFDHCNLKNVSVKINGHRYPAEMQNCDMTAQNYRLLYDQYLTFRKLMYGDTDVYVNMDDFKSRYPIIVIDTHLHPTSRDRSRNDIQVELDFTTAVASAQGDVGTTAYIILVSQTEFMYDITRNTIRMVQ
ncbi:uncharacterized protein LOC124358167 [Homalodisca vitripennis]|uniref:uncharacterized protein LOC124358167 n=1 Tax=Homalodisca vitripennis TaxID=197043 RepID=UPI001EEAF69B|nr:uncharacterized protein LOC124358167 [Homalodisca vitripennis]